MKKYLSVFFALLISILFFAAGSERALASSDYTVEEVTEMLSGIDTLAQMQSKRSKYTTSGHYDLNTTSTAVINRHNTARAGYEGYVADMLGKRAEAQKAYDALSQEQKALIDPSLAAKLNNELPTVWQTGEYAVTPRDDEYSFEAVDVGLGFAYEVSNHMISGSIPQTFVLVDTSDGSTSWTPSGEYVYGESNYEVVYCCDKETGLEYGTDYKRVNLEDSGYFDVAEAQHIRAVLENAYPFITIDEMKSRLIEGGLEKDFVDGLTRADLIAAVQMAVWSYANINDAAADGLEYFASIDIPKNTGIYFNPLHDYTNEVWDWLPGKRQRSFDVRAQHRVNTLGEYLCSLKPAEVTTEQMIISDLEVVKTELIDEENGLYHITMYITLNGGGNAKDDLNIHAESYSTDEEGNKTVTEKASCKAVSDNGVYKITTHAKDGDMIEITVSGNQKLPRGVYFYDPGHREDSQSLVGVSEGITAVNVSKSTLFIAELAKIPVEDIEINASEIEITENDEIQLIVTVKPEDATNKEIIFESDDETVVTVDENGNIKAVGTGTAVITVTSADNPSVRKEIIITVLPEPAAPVPPAIPTIPKKHYICFGKTDGIGWYEVSVNGGDFFPQGPNSTLEVDEGSIIAVRVQDMWIDDNFTFYVNGERVEKDAANTIVLKVEGYMLIGALSMDVEVPDVEESVNIFQRIINAIKAFFDWLSGLFKIK